MKKGYQKLNNEQVKRYDQVNGDALAVSHAKAAAVVGGLENIAHLQQTAEQLAANKFKKTASKPSVQSSSSFFNCCGCFGRKTDDSDKQEVKSLLSPGK